MFLLLKTSLSFLINFNHCGSCLLDFRFIIFIVVFYQKYKKKVSFKNSSIYLQKRYLNRFKWILRIIMRIIFNFLKEKNQSLKAHEAWTSRKNGPSCPAENVEGIMKYDPAFTSFNVKATNPHLKKIFIIYYILCI